MNPKKALEKMYRLFAAGVNDINQRIDALVQAVGLMDQICGSLQVMHHRNPAVGYMPANAEKLWDKAKKCRARAMGTPFEHEKETSLRMCLMFMEKLANKLNPPKLESYILRLETKQQKNTAKASAKKKTAGPRKPSSNDGIPQLNSDGFPMFRPGSSAEICMQALLSQPRTSLTSAVKAVDGKFKTSNVKGRVIRIAAMLITLNKLRRVKVGGEVYYEVI